MTQRTRRTVILACIVGLITLGLRLVNLSSSFDIFIDETLYLNISESVSSHASVDLFNQPFFLHPPASFYVMGAFIRLFHPTGNMIERIYSLRQLNAFLAALTAVVLFLVTVQTTRQLKWGFLAATLFILDPYIVFMNGRVMLETSAVLWAVAGFWLLLGGVTDAPKRPSLQRAILIGVLFGLGILSKDMIAFVTLVPVVLLFLMNWALPRRFLFTVGAVPVAVYSVYLLAVLLAGQMSLFIDEKFSGLRRMLGSVQITGMNRNVGPSLLQKLTELIGLYAGTYIFFGIGIIALVFLLTSKLPKHRIVVVWSASAYALLGYSVLFGTLEDQFFYSLAVPVVVLVSISAAHLLDLQARATSLWGTRAHRLRGAFTWFSIRAVLVTLVLIIGWNAVRWVVVHSTPTNGYEQALDYLRTYAPVGSRVASTSEIGQFVLSDGIDRLNPNGPWSLWSQARDLVQYQPDYVIVSLNQLEWDHGDKALALVEWLDRNAHPVFKFGPVEGSPTGKLIVYRLDNLNVAQLAPTSTQNPTDQAPIPPTALPTLTPTQSPTSPTPTSTGPPVPTFTPPVTTVVVTPMEVTPEARSTPERQRKTYKVRAGDNLFRIGLRFGVTVGALRTANRLSSNLIHVGQVLVIP